MIPTRRRNPWRWPLRGAFALYAIAFVLRIFIDTTGALPLLIVVVFLGLVVVALVIADKRYEDESIRIVAAEVYGRDQEAAWSRGFDAGVVTERRRHQR